eukprot:gene237-287_t
MKKPTEKRYRGKEQKEKEQRAQRAEESVKDAQMKERPAGVYIPPFRLAMMQKQVTDKSSVEYQRMEWDALKKSLNGLINKVSTSNIKNIAVEMFGENIIRGRGLLARSLMRAQQISPKFTNVYAALLAIINSKLPDCGELVLKRLIETFKKAFRRNDKTACLATSKFIAHLANQQICGIIVPLEVITLLLDRPTDDSVEVAVDFLKECGQILQEVTSAGFNGAYDRLRAILHEGEIDKRVQFMIEDLFKVIRTGFAEFPAIVADLDVVEIEDQITHEDLSLEETYGLEDETNFFREDPEFLANHEKFLEVKRIIEDQTDTNLVTLKRTIYLIIMSSKDFEECVHKILRMKIPEGQEIEICNMVIQCCSQERTYLTFYGNIAQRFCMINRVYRENFELCFTEVYATIHRMETNKFRNIAKLYAHMLYTDGLPWTVMENIHINEEETNSASRIFIKIMFQEISEFLGIQKLNERLQDPAMQEYFQGIFPKDNPKNTRYAINFFTSIALGALTYVYYQVSKFL